MSAALLWRSTFPNAHEARLDAVRDDTNALGFVMAQWSKLSRGLWHALEYAGVFCVNPATSVAMWEDKVTQLVVADQVGLATPATRYLGKLNYNLNDRGGNPLNFDVSQLGWPSALTGQMSDTHRFPSLTITGYRGTGWTSRQANGFYQKGLNGTLSKLAGTHNFKAGGDYRQIGVKALNYGASTGTYTFSGTFTGNAMADLLLGPLLRYVSETEATVWVETTEPCEVRVLGRRERTFSVAGHHYALVQIEGLEPLQEPEVRRGLDGDRVARP